MNMKLHILQVTIGTAMIALVFVIVAMVNRENTTQNQPNVTVFPTPTGWITPNPTQISEMDNLAIFPSAINCTGITSLSPGPSWEWIRIGETTFDELIDHLETLPLTITLYNVGWNKWRITFSDVNSIQQEWTICVFDDHITTFRIEYYAKIPEAYVWDAIANWGTPDAVVRTGKSTTRSLFWFDRGITLTVWVWKDSEIIEYGRIMGVTYFPYVDPENYEDAYPYNQTNTVLGGLPASPSIPLDLDPLDYDAILATVTPGTITDVIGGQ